MVAVQAECFSICSVTEAMGCRNSSLGKLLGLGPVGLRGLRVVGCSVLGLLQGLELRVMHGIFVSIDGPYTRASLSSCSPFRAQHP